MCLTGNATSDSLVEKPVKSLRSAIAFLTILPVAPSDATGKMASARAWFPVVGLILGGILAAVDLMVSSVSSIVGPSNGAMSSLLPAVALTVTLVVMTRALHIDGFMDCCDALFGGFDRERRLRILRDPHVGAFAVTGVVCLLLLKVAAITSLAQSVRVWIVLVFPCLSRWSVTLVMELFPYVRSRGIGTSFLEDMRKWQILFALFVTLAAAFTLAGLAGLILFATVSLTAWMVAAWASRLLGGVTGDVYGAIVEISETTILLVSVFLAHALLISDRPPLIWLLD